MNKLILYGLHKGLYQDANDVFKGNKGVRTAFAYLAYGSKENPIDNNNQQVWTNEFKFAQHLREVVVPVINPNLIKGGYKAVDVENNQGSNPCLIIRRTDNGFIHDMDMNKIENLINKTINLFNKNLTKENSRSSSTFFHKAANVETKAFAKVEHHYSLRPRN